ncbi:MAG: chemotaxis protein CheA [Thermodesulfobacteriota bacterium]
MDPHREAYLLEAQELLAELETGLLELEEAAGDAELVGRVFRALHTIKGSGAMFGFDEVAAFTHEVENAFDRVRSGTLAVSRELVDIGLGAKDHVRALLAGSGEPRTGEDVLERLRALTGGGAEEGAAPSQASEGAAGSDPEAAADATYRIRWKPGPGLFATGTNPLVLLDELRALGSCRVVAQTGDVPALDALDPQECRLYWDVILTTGRGRDAIEDVFLFVSGEGEVRIDLIDAAGVSGCEADYKRLGEILVERGDLSVEEMRAALAEQKRFGEIVADKGLVSPSQVESALAEQQAVRQARQARQTQAPSEGEAASSIRVPSEKLDRLVDLVGELVIAQARLTQTANTRADPALVAIAEDLERLASELRDNTLNIRMVPIGTTFGRFRRLVRDLSAELGKEIDLVTDGAETELDKTVIERLGDPLVHLIRNCLDHGIEAPEVRAAAGKPRRGTVRLSAAHEGASVVLAIADDGRGLDAEAIRAKAVEKGLLSPDARPPERELFDLVFAPGFSTAKAVTGVSGRGVGMDVVRRAIEALRGTVELASRPGRGTSVTVRLPLTLAIIEGLLVGVGGERYVVPLSLVEECVELAQADRVRARGRSTVEVRGHLVPYVRLREWFGAGGRPPEIEQVVVVRLEEGRFGFVVDGVIGQHQTVIKPLGRMVREVEGLSGATILGDGAVALILDPPRIVQGVEEAARRAA